ncbi:hypothetical protein JCM19233_5535 [Vibrio astriarenae]|nr:hypothetical protein JCM19233_5535 [Vibrio sp. C7]
MNTNVNAAPVNDGELRMVTLNTWFDQYKNSGLTNDFFVNGNYDIVFTQEAQGAVYINEISSALNKNKSL